MKKYTAPNMEISKFNAANIVTTSGEAPVKENAVAAATAHLSDEVKVDGVLKLTL